MNAAAAGAAQNALFPQEHEACINGIALLSVIYGLTTQVPNATSDDRDLAVRRVLAGCRPAADPSRGDTDHGAVSLHPNRGLGALAMP